MMHLAISSRVDGAHDCSASGLPDSATICQAASNAEPRRMVVSGSKALRARSEFMGIAVLPFLAFLARLGFAPLHDLDLRSVAPWCTRRSAGPRDRPSGTAQCHR